MKLFKVMVFILGKYLAKNVGKNISKYLSGNYSQKPLHHAKQSATDALKTTTKGVIQKTPEATGDLIDTLKFLIVGGSNKERVWHFLKKP